MNNSNKNNISHPFYKRHDHILAYYETLETQFCFKI